MQTLTAVNKIKFSNYNKIDNRQKEQKHDT